MALKEGRSSRKLGLLKKDEIDFQFMRSLSAMSDGGAAVGECLVVRDATKDSASSARAWFRLAQQLEEQAASALKNGHTDTAKRRYLRAMNYYRSAVNMFSPVDEPDEHRASWKKSTEMLERVGSMFDKPLERVEVPFEGGILPCYLLRANDGKPNRPTLIGVTGGEGSPPEMYFWIGGAGLRRGYNVLLCDIPGNVGALYRNNLKKNFTLRADAEKPISAIIDKLITLPEVDPKKIALIGFSYGGYFVNRAAVHDKRIAALIPDTPVRNAFAIWQAILPKWFLGNNTAMKFLDFAAGKMLRRANKATFDIVLWLTGSNKISAFVEFTRQSNIIGHEQEITCPVLGLFGEAEGPILERQAKEFMSNIGSTNKKLHAFAIADGGGAHCQVDNYNTLQETVYDWLDDVLKS